MNIKDRFSPFLVLLEARYLPLLLLALPQSYTVALWLMEANKGKPFAEFFAVVGAAAFEFSYVGAIAWAESQTKSSWMWCTAISALTFSVLVAVRVHWQSEWLLSFLHAGFPLTAFAYTMTIHTAIIKAAATAAVQQLPQQLAQAVAAQHTQNTLEQYPAQPQAELEQVQQFLLSDSPMIVAQRSNRTTTTTTETVATTKPRNELMELAHNLRAIGRTQKEIAVECGVSESTIRNWLAK